MSMHPVRRGATARGLDLVGHGADRAAQRNGASTRTRKREKEGGGGDQSITQWLLLPIYKRERGAEIERDVVTCTVYLLLFAFYLNSSKKVKFCLL
jgi:hypothetical protein